MRKLRQAYTGYCMKVRRSSDSAEQDIGFDAAGNLDLNALINFVGTGTGYVKTWYDQSGNSNDATQTSTVTQPMIMNAGVIYMLNGRPIVSFAGSTKLLYTTITGVLTVNAVSIASSNSSLPQVGASLALNTNHRVAFLSSSMLWRSGSGSPTLNYGSQSGLFSGTAISNGSTAVSVYLNGVKGATAVTTVSSLTIDQLGAYQSNCYGGQMAEVILYTTALSTTNRQVLENDQARYYQLTVTDTGYIKPLDSVGSATSAYGLRKLRAAYAGSAIRVRRSSDNTEQDIGFDSLGNLDIATMMNFVGTNSAYVKIWYDQSGNGYDASQTTTANQPRIVNAGTLDTQSGRPALYFNGTAYYLTTGSSISITGTTATAVAVVNMDSSAPSYARVLSGKATGDTTDNATTLSGVFFCRNNGGTRVAAWRQNAVKGSTISGSYGLMTQLSSAYDGSTSKMRINGVAGSSVASTGSFGIDQLWIGASPLLPATDYWKGYESELILYPTAVTTANQQVLEGNQMAYYNVGDTMPGTGFVTKWYDQSGNGYDLSQTTSLLQPIIRWDNKTNRAAVYFNGNNTFLASPTTLSITGTTATAFTVANMYSTTPAMGRILGGKDNGSSGDNVANTSASIFLTNNGTNQVAGWRGNAVKSAGAVTTNKMFQATSAYDGTNHTMRVNGQAASSVASSGSFNINQLWVGTAPTTLASEFWNGTISEIILYPSTLTTAQMQVMERSQHTFYGTP